MLYVSLPSPKRSIAQIHRNNIFFQTRIMQASIRTKNIQSKTEGFGENMHTAYI